MISMTAWVGRVGGAVAGLTVTAWVSAAWGQGIALELPRGAYCRGETIPLVVRVPEGYAAGKVSVSLDSLPLFTGALTGLSTGIPVPTASVRVGQYTLRAVVNAAGGELSATSPVTVARRPAADRLEVWLWCYGGGAGDFGYYYDHGFTIAGGANAVRWDDAQRADVIASLDARLARGVYSSVIACGGISRSELKDVDAEAEDAAYQGAGRHPERFLNPWHPAVEKKREELNATLFKAIGDHPAVKVAFYNTELVDDLWFENQNRTGAELAARALGFTRDQRGAPTFVAPGVLANDDRGYRFQKFVYTQGNGLAYASRRTAEDIKALRPDVWTLTDPYRQVTYLDMFPGLDLVGTWTYTNNDPKLMLYIETLRALTRGTGQRPLQTVTLLNYPGTLAPRSETGESSTSQWFASNPSHAGWVLMGPDRCKEVSWIILSRAPQVIGYYFSSACDPQEYSKPEDQFRVPHATSDAIKELSDRVFRPYGAMIRRLDVAPRRIAVLSSQASRLYGKSPRSPGYPNEQIYGFYSVMAMAHLDGDVLFDEHVERGALRNYDVLALPRCDVVTEALRDEILAFARRGGCVIADSYLGLEVPGAIRTDFDFTYRGKVNADAIASGTMFAEWDDQLNPKTAALAEAKGVTAEDDQRIMESYARRLREALAGKVEPAVAVDSPKALVNVLEKHGVKYLVLVNDRREYDERTGKYKAIMEKLVPQTVSVQLRDWRGPLCAYDLLERKALPVAAGPRGLTVRVDLGAIGGTIVALYAAPLGTVAIAASAEMTRGTPSAFTVALTAADGRPMPGLQPVRVTVLDPLGREADCTADYCAENGRLEVPFSPALNDEPGGWRLVVTDLTAGLSAERAVTVK